jgi:PPP family 3-phenylpropionic acid transporter
VNRFFSGRHQARGQAIYTSFAFGVGGTLGGIYAGSAWERLGPNITFTGAALCAFAGMLILWRNLRENEVAASA